MAGGNKRPAPSSGETDNDSNTRLAKRAKIQVPLGAAIKKLHKSIAITDIDDYICTDNYPGVGILTKQVLMTCEASFLQRVQLPFHKYQSRMIDAQYKYRNQMAGFLVSNIHTTNSVKDTTIVTAACRLLYLVENDDFEWSDEMADAIKYRVAFLTAFEAYRSGNVETTYKKVAECAFDEISAAEIVQELTQASERHLSRPQDRSALWTPISPSSAPPAPSSSSAGSASVSGLPQITPVDTIPGSRSLIASGNASNPYTLDYLQQRATAYVTTWEQFMTAAEPPSKWEDLASISEDQKMSLVAAHRGRSLGLITGYGTPMGTLLHGVQGAGKNELVESWCVNIKGVQIKIDRTVQGALTGQTEQLLQILFTKAVELAKSQPVIIFFDEVDQWLTIPTKEGQGQGQMIQMMQASLRDIFNIVMKSGSEIYIFGATNRPERIDMEDWGRRFYNKWHVKVPDTTTKANILGRSLAKNKQVLLEEDLQFLAKRMVNYSPNDIHGLVRYVVDIKVARLDGCDKWESVDVRGTKAFMPATSNCVAEAIIESSFEAMVAEYRDQL